MNDDRLIRDLRALDRPVTVDTDFADRLFGRLREERQTRHRRWPALLLAAALFVGASIGAVVISGGGPDQDPTAPESAIQMRMLPSREGPIQVSFALPADLDLGVIDRDTSITFAPMDSPVQDPDSSTSPLPEGARGVRIVDVAGATAHYSNDRPLGTDAASFLTGLRDHQILDADLGPIQEARLGETPALMADVVRIAPDAHLDRDGKIISLWPASRLVLANVGDAIVLVQIWAASPAELSGWLPQVEALVGSLRLTPTG